jgi:hypothetical protein
MIRIDYRLSWTVVGLCVIFVSCKPRSVPSTATRSASSSAVAMSANAADATPSFESALILGDTDAVRITLCLEGKECTSELILSDNVLPPDPAANVKSMAFQTCYRSSRPEAKSLKPLKDKDFSCTDPVTVSRQQMMAELAKQDTNGGKDAGLKLADTSVTGSITTDTAIFGTAAVVVVTALGGGAYWAVRYFKYADSASRKIAETTGPDFAKKVSPAEGVPVSGKSVVGAAIEVGVPVRKLSGKMLSVFDLDKTLVDETYKPDAVEAVKGQDVPKGWIATDIGGKAVWVKKPNWKPGALDAMLSLMAKGHYVGIGTFNHRPGVEEALKTELKTAFEEGQASGRFPKELSFDDMMAKQFAVEAPKARGNPLIDINATKSLVLDLFQGGKTTMMENLLKRFEIDGPDKVDAVFFADDKFRFIDQVRRTSTAGIPIVGLKVEDIDGKGLDVSHLRFLEGLTDAAEYSRVIGKTEFGQDLILRDQDMGAISKGAAGEAVKLRQAWDGRVADAVRFDVEGATGFKTNPNAAAGFTARRSKFEVDEIKGAKRIEGDVTTGDKLKAGAGALVFMGVVAGAMAGIGYAAESANSGAEGSVEAP